MQVIAIDCGRDTLKAITGNRRASIKSTVGEPRELKIGDYGDYDVIINGQRNFLGELAERESRFRREMVSRSKIHEDTAILSLTAIALLASETDIRVVTGLPVEQHDQATKKEYINLLSGNHIITVNGQRHNIRLSEDDIAVGIEGGGAYWARKNRYLNCIVIDIGSRTVNVVCVFNGRFRDVDSFTLNYGCLELENAAENPGDMIASQLTRRIYADISKRLLSIKYPVLLAGGGAILLEPWLKQYYPTAETSEEPVWDNAIGLGVLGDMKWQTKN
ncbi:ParM/StbA family protein [Pelosinus sp. UFO1]|uniref:ParM/StbA family protein n=1 Tax=Pelosinus sp. UFO1 TaxID=484770 RepID=UPI0004D1A51E|nr:ParM/StbA family protein [Pelosinus sp. UFO1]AIF51983.1 hypothetical protein UFO1_2436 [Pelosinus sp. UFO1]